MKLRHTDWIQPLIFDFEGYQVIKLTDLESKLNESDFTSLLSSLDGKTLTIDKEGNTLIFYSDISGFVIVDKY
jgi:hypothetical protein